MRTTTYLHAHYVLHVHTIIPPQKDRYWSLVISGIRTGKAGPRSAIGRAPDS